MQWKVRPGFFRGSLGDMAKKPRTLHQRLTGKLFKARDCRCSLFIFTSVTGVTQIPIDIARKKNVSGAQPSNLPSFFFLTKQFHLFCVRIYYEKDVQVSEISWKIIQAPKAQC